MPKINNIITPQVTEILRDRIADILYDEIQNQANLTQNEELDVTVTIENKSPNDFTEFPLINVSVVNVDYSNKNQGSVDGNFQVFIDAYTCSASGDYTDGAKKATMQLQKIIGICRYILEDPQYKTLGFAPFPNPFILKTLVSNIAFKEVDANDANNVAMGRLTFSVTANESNKLLVPVLIGSYKTTVNIGTTNVGYLYTS